MVDITFPVGRMISGSMYKSYPRKESDGTPSMRDGKIVEVYSFGCAIPKGGEQHWQQTPWGVEIAQVGNAAYGGIAQRPDFSWKVTDGDSTIENTAGKIPNRQPGYAGSWVLWFSQQWPIRLCNADGSKDLVEVDAIVPGYYIQVRANVKANGSSTDLAKKQKKPGVYLNPLAVALSGYGERLNTIDTTNVGFGSSPLPQGASPVPIGAMPGTPPPVQQTGQYTPPPAAYTPPPVQQTGQYTPPPVQQAAAYAPPPVQQPPQYSPPPAAYTPPPVQQPPQYAPNPAILGAPPVQHAVPNRIMLPAANGATYEQLIGMGWTDELLVAHQYMLVA